MTWTADLPGASIRNYWTGKMRAFLTVSNKMRIVYSDQHARIMLCRILKKLYFSGPQFIPPGDLSKRKLPFAFANPV
jgi:hypothetical protein